MSNPLNLAPHEVGELLADLDETVQFLEGLNPVSEEESEELDDRDVLQLTVHIVDSRGNIVEIVPDQFARWVRSLRKIEQLVK